MGVIRGMSCRYLWHEELELMLSLSGEIEYFAGEKCYHLRKGDMLLFNRNCGHSIISRGSGNRTISLKLSPQVLADWEEGKSSGRNERMEVSFACDYPTVLVFHRDRLGVISRVTGILAEEGINIAFMRVFRSLRHENACMVIETDGEAGEAVLRRMEKECEEVEEVCML